MSMHSELRANLVKQFKEEEANLVPGGVLLFQASQQQLRDDSDHEPVFRQESNFHYLFGVKEPGGYGIIDVDTGKTTLFFERLDASLQMWMGTHTTMGEFKEMYKVDAVHYNDEMVEVLKANATTPCIYVLSGVNTDSGSAIKAPEFKGKEEFDVKLSNTLYNAQMKCRTIKTEKEVELLRHVNIVSSEAHMAVMQHCQPGVTEFQNEALFKYWCYYNGGARFSAYTCICGSGANCAALHYGHAGAPNLKKLDDGDVCLHDMGGEYHCYASDITNSFPCNGMFTDTQKIVYSAVLASNWGVMKAMKPGVSWVDMHELSYRLMLEKLKEGGLVTGDIKEMMDVNLGSVFMPHGLGHFMGKDTHDVGGYLEGMPERPKLFGFRSLRTACVLEAGMVITVEPGCYFIDYILDEALKKPEQSKFINTEMLAKLRGFGGVRLEDNVLITPTGIENLTWAPRLIEEVEGVCQGKILDRHSFERIGVLDNSKQ